MTEDELHREKLTDENFLGKPENKGTAAIRELQQNVGTTLAITLLASVIAGVVVGFLSYSMARDAQTPALERDPVSGAKGLDR